MFSIVAINSIILLTFKLEGIFSFNLFSRINKFSILKSYENDYYYDQNRFSFINKKYPDNFPKIENYSNKNTIFEKTDDLEGSTILKDDISTYGVCTALATEHLALGNLKEAELLAEMAIETIKAEGVTDNIYQAYAEGILGEVLFAEGDFQDAAEHYHMALKTYEHHMQSETSPESVMIVAATQLISWQSLAQNNSQIMQETCRKALSMTEKLLGPDDPNTAVCMLNLALANMQMGNLGKGTEGLLTRALQIYDLNDADYERKVLHGTAKRNVLHLLTILYSKRL